LEQTSLTDIEKKLYPIQKFAKEAKFLPLYKILAAGFMNYAS